MWEPVLPDWAQTSGWDGGSQRTPAPSSRLLPPGRRESWRPCQRSSAAPKSPPPKKYRINKTPTDSTALILSLRAVFPGSVYSSLLDLFLVADPEREDRQHRLHSCTSLVFLSCAKKSHEMIHQLGNEQLFSPSPWSAHTFWNHHLWPAIVPSAHFWNGKTFLWKPTTSHLSPGDLGLCPVTTVTSLWGKRRALSTLEGKHASTFQHFHSKIINFSNFHSQIWITKISIDGQIREMKAATALTEQFWNVQNMIPWISARLVYFICTFFFPNRMPFGGIWSHAGRQ